MMMPVFDSADQVQRWALKNVLEKGGHAAPRDQRTRELLFVSFSLANPRHRRIHIPERRWSFPLALGEFCWHAAGSDDVRFISSYNEHWRDFSDDGKTIRGSCYGRKMFGSDAGDYSQWHRVIELLKRDPETRRATLVFQHASDPSLLSKDVACATSLQFLIRDRALHAIVNMRSNDCVWGLPYDLFVFTMFQELMARTLGLSLGSYNHVAASLHIYEQHYELAERVARSPDHISDPMPCMGAVSDLSQFLAEEENIRLGRPLFKPLDRIDPYWANLLKSLQAYHARRG